LLRQLWQEWLVLARHIGNFQARVLITLVYFTLILPFGLVVTYSRDVLRMKRVPANRAWLERVTRDFDLEQARRQG